MKVKTGATFDVNMEAKKVAAIARPKLKLFQRAAKDIKAEVRHTSAIAHSRSKYTGIEYI